MADYPVEYESTALLRDGSSVLVRPIRPEDGSALLALHGRLSRESVYFRFFSPMPRLNRDQLRHLVELDYVNGMGLVAERDQRIIGVGHYYRIPGSDHADVAFTVDDAYQGRGVATLLLERLIEVARARGIRVFEADVLAENTRMLRVFTAMGFEISRQLKSGVVHVLFRIDPTADAVARAEARERVAVTSSLEPVLAPRSIAVVGAKRRPGTIGYGIFRNLVLRGFQGPVYPVNHRAPVVGSVRAYASVADIPGPVDLAIIAVPAPAVRSVVEDCAAHGVKAVAVISGGFAETGEAGKAAQDALARLTSSHGMRMLGPNCLGLMNTDPDVQMDAMFSPVWPAAGPVAIASQSGALGLAILDYLQMLALGVSTFVSLGNTADISANDLLQWWEEDPAISTVLLYLERFGEARRFARLARRIAARKPIVAVKSVRAGSERRSPATPAAAMASLDDVASGLFAQAGVIRTRTLEELLDVATLLAHQPIPLGNRVGILTNADGPGALATDACEAQGLVVGGLSEKTQLALRDVLPPLAEIANPVDLVGDATPEHYGRGLELLLADPSVDAVIVIFVPPLAPPATAVEEVANAIVRAAATAGHKPVLSCFMSARGVPEALRHGMRPIPSYVFPESAALALARAAHYGAWRRQPAGIAPDLPGLNREEARRITEAAEAGWMPEPNVRRLLACYGIRSAPAVPADTAADAVKAAQELGYPVTLRLEAPDPAGKVDVRGLPADCAGDEHVRAAFLQLHGSRAAPTVIVQPIVKGGHEAFVGVTTDPNLGPIVSFALGGISMELLRDVAFRITPITDRDAREMVRAVRSFPLLEGWRGSPAGDVDAVEELILRVSAMVEDLPELGEMELNPLRVLPPGEGTVVVHARINVRRTPAP